MSEQISLFGAAPRKRKSAKNPGKKLRAIAAPRKAAKNPAGRLTYHVQVSSYGKKGWRVSSFADNPNDPWGLGINKNEQFVRSEAAANKLAQQWARDLGTTFRPY